MVGKRCRGLCAVLLEIDPAARGQNAARVNLAAELPEPVVGKWRVEEDDVERCGSRVLNVLRGIAAVNNGPRRVENLRTFLEYRGNTTRVLHEHR